MHKILISFEYAAFISMQRIIVQTDVIICQERRRDRQREPSPPRDQAQTLVAVIRSRLRVSYHFLELKKKEIRSRVLMLLIPGRLKCPIIRTGSDPESLSVLLLPGWS